MISLFSQWPNRDQSQASSAFVITFRPLMYPCRPAISRVRYLKDPLSQDREAFAIPNAAIPKVAIPKILCKSPVTPSPFPSHNSVFLWQRTHHTNKASRALTMAELNQYNRKVVWLCRFFDQSICRSFNRSNILRHILRSFVSLSQFCFYKATFIDVHLTNASSL